jgi:hypothetical protein
MVIGYIYCISNENMPNIYKIGYTERKPTERLKKQTVQIHSNLLANTF